MNSISIQFHSTNQELLDFINETASLLLLDKVLIQVKPFKIVFVPEAITSLHLEDLDLSADKRVLLFNDSINVDAESVDTLLEMNAGVIEFEVGSENDKELNESALSFMSDDAAAYKLAKKVAARLKKFTKAGVIAVNPQTGAEAPVRTHRYTQGAKKLYDQGVKILPLVTTNLLKL